jgi:hypothetical protein
VHPDTRTRTRTRQCILDWPLQGVSCDPDLRPEFVHTLHVHTDLLLLWADSLEVLKDACEHLSGSGLKLHFYLLVNSLGVVLEREHHRCIRAGGKIGGNGAAEGFHSAEVNVGYCSATCVVSLNLRVDALYSDSKQSIRII